jgi:hypothetical protein
MNPLDNYPSARKVAYLLQWLSTLATGILGVIFTAGDEVPEWYTVTVAVLAFVWSYTGLTAQTNVDQPAHRDERGASDLVVLGVVFLFALVILIATGVLR